MGNFTHLHLHSEYSLLDGACRIGDIPKMAKSMGHTAVAITDHGVLYGAVEFWRACQAEGVKPIIGCEVYVAARGMEHKEGRADLSGEHLVLLVENEVGYRNLIQLVSRSFTDGFYMKSRVDWALLSKHHEGLIALSACIAGEIPQHILAGDYERAKTRACEMQALFGEGHFYLELQDHGLADEKRVCSSLAAISRETGIPLVATNDVHYLRRRDSEMQAVLMCIQTNKVLTDGRPIGFETDEFYYKSTEEMEQLFSAYPDACANSQKIADRCQFDFVFGEYKLPTCPTEPGLSHRETLEKYAFGGFQRLSDGGHITFDRNSREEYESRIRYELDVIDKMGFSAYFLIVRDFVTYSKTHGIAVGPGRGSGAGSLVAYCVGITDVDSIRYDLLFERFLNPERLSMPDFDIDFCYENRDRAIAYVRERYGDDHVAQIITFGTLAARAAVRDVGRALDIPYATVDAVAKMIPMHATLDEALAMKELKARYEEDEEVRRLMDLSRSVEGMPRHASTHAAGVVITEMPVSHYVPLAVNGDVVVTQYDMDTVASLGLIKFDFLGLRYLTVMEKAQTAIRERMPEFDLTRIPFDDPATYRAISQGKTEAVFQLESQGIRRVLSEMKPSCFEDIIATIALYRPGPMDSIDTFIARKHGIESATYDTPLLAPILDNTYGCIVYQEQVMQIFRSLAGYSFARADLVRRAMSKKKADVMAAEKSNFIAGCAERGISSTVAEKIFADMESFASYAFNKSHATAYAMISYRTAYLKTHFPAEYLAAIMSCGSACDPSQFDVKVLPPSINESTLGFTAGEGTVRYGFLAIKNVGRQFIEGLLDERKNGQFRSFEDFIDRMASRGEVNRRQIEAMIKCGCFDVFGVYRSRLLAVYEDVITRAVSRAHTNVTGQLDLFSALGMEEEAPAVVYPPLPEFPLKDLLAFEKETTGIYFSGNLIDHYRNHAESLPHIPILSVVSAFDENGDSAGDLSDRQKVSVAGVVTACKTKTTRKGDEMAFVTLEDTGASMEIIVFPKQWAEWGRYMKVGAGVYVEGEVNIKEGEAAKIALSRAVPLLSNEEYTPRAPQERPKTLYLRVPAVDDPMTQVVLKLLRLVPGENAVVFYDEKTKKYLKNGTVTVRVDDKLLSDLGRVLGDGAVVFK